MESRENQACCEVNIVTICPSLARQTSRNAGSFGLAPGAKGCERPQLFFKCQTKNVTMGKTQWHCSPHQSCPTRKCQMESRGCRVNICGGVHAQSGPGPGQHTPDPASNRRAASPVLPAEFFSLNYSPVWSALLVSFHPSTFENTIVTFMEGVANTFK